MATCEGYSFKGLAASCSSDIGKLRVPTAYFYGAKDRIEPLPATEDAAARLPGGDRSAFYMEGWHLLLLDRHAKVVWTDVDAFIRDPFPHRCADRLDIVGDDLARYEPVTGGVEPLGKHRAGFVVGERARVRNRQHRDVERDEAL